MPVLSRVLAFLAFGYIACASAKADLLADLTAKQGSEAFAIARAFGNELQVVWFDGRTATRPLNSSAYLQDAAFLASRAGLIGSSPAGLVEMDADGRILWTEPRIRRAWDIDISADDRTVAFASDEGIFALVVATRELTSIGKGDHPSWSPDGRHIVFSSGGRLIVSDLATKRRVVLTEGSHPDWASDGRRIIYRATNEDYRLLSLDETLRVASDRRLFRGRRVVQSPKWSPNDQYLLYTIMGVPEGERGRDALEPKTVMIYRLRDGSSAGVYMLGKSAPFKFSWIPAAKADVLHRSE